MSKFNQSSGNDSFDDILAKMDVPSSVPCTPSEPKKQKLLEVSSDGDIDDLLANITLPTNINAKISATEITNTKPASSAASSTSTANTNTNSGSSTSTSKTNCILVNPKQRGNPILKSITNAPWEFDDEIIPDYVVGATAGILYISLRYHQLNPDYIHNRLKELGKRFELRILLVQVDTKVNVKFIFIWNHNKSDVGNTSY